MTEQEFTTKLNNLELILMKRNNETWIIQRKGIGNPLLFFNPIYRDEEYSGTIQVKAYNIALYHPSQVYPAIKLVNEFLFNKNKSQ